jgi:hypothetical protein
MAIMRSTDGLPETAAHAGIAGGISPTPPHAGLRTWLVGTLAAFGLTAAGVFALATLADYRSTLEEGGARRRTPPCCSPATATTR